MALGSWIIFQACSGVCLLQGRRYCEMTSTSTAELPAADGIWTTSQEAQCIVTIAYSPVLCG